jgi:nucleoside-diphosphate-sugar epimerase
MKVFVTGATGFVGSAVVDELLAHGHAVVGLARTGEGARRLSGKGVESMRGNLEDPRTLKDAASKADGVIHLAFMHTPSKASFGSMLRILLGGSPGGIVDRFMAATTAVERNALAAMGSALANSGRPFVTTFATMGLAGDHMRKQTAAEDDAPDRRSPGYARAKLEEEVEALASTGVRATMIRLSPSVHGPGDSGLIPEIIKLSRKHGKSIYLGDGANRWPAVHVRDAARLFRLALEDGVAGTRYHAVAEEGTPFRAIAEQIANRLGIPALSATSSAASKQLGWLSSFVACDNPCSSEITRRRLGWKPTEPTLLEDLRQDRYYAP